jgi:hypothetical protein
MNAYEAGYNLEQAFRHVAATTLLGRGYINASHDAAALIEMLVAQSAPAYSIDAADERAEFWAEWAKVTPATPYANILRLVSVFGGRSRHWVRPFAA